MFILEVVPSATNDLLYDVFHCLVTQFGFRTSAISSTSDGEE